MTPTPSHDIEGDALEAVDYIGQILTLSQKNQELERALQAAREACAKIADGYARNAEYRAAGHESKAAKEAALDKFDAGMDIAAAIRARPARSMTTNRTVKGATEALEFARGESPAAAIWRNGFRYVPETKPLKEVAPQGDVVERVEKAVWEELLERCAATPRNEWDSVTHLIRVPKGAVEAAARSALEAMQVK